MRKGRKSVKTKRILTGAVMLVLALVLAAGAFGPVVSNHADLPSGYAEAIHSQSKGLYSPKLPLFPIWTNVTGYEKETVFYTAFYFPLGTVGMSYHPEDGYNIEKPLTRW